MSLIKGLPRRRALLIAFAAAFVMLAGFAAWHVSKRPAEASSEDKQRLQERLRRGVGSEVRFASRPEQADEAVKSADDFIYSRAGLRMSDETKKRLAKAESDVLKGKAKRITAAELTDTLTEGAVERLSNITDEEIQQTADAAANEHGEVRSRADGRWGTLSKEEFIQQMKSGREWSQRGDSASRATLHMVIEEEVNDRATKLSAALPEQFGQANTQGFTPTQALIVSYSVSADDPLTDSRSDISQAMVQKRMDARQTREQKKAQRNVSGHPYGARGAVHASPTSFFKAGVEKLLSRSEGGKK
ncbi:MAG TPA: hypothetical protein VGW12_18700 [Pyrinomonadaceae bacterium]|nr:hypothetical protein [Pyrinomonadaceae bacterium]